MDVHALVVQPGFEVVELVDFEVDMLGGNRETRFPLVRTVYKPGQNRQQLAARSARGVFEKARCDLCPEAVGVVP